MSAFLQQAVLQVRYLATDSPSPKLFRELKEIWPNLSCLSLDPFHVAIVYEPAQWGKKTAGSKALRRLLNKVNQVAPNRRSRAFHCLGPVLYRQRPTQPEPR